MNDCAKSAGNERLTDMLDRNKMQLLASTDVARNILRKLDGNTRSQIEPCSNEKRAKDPELPGVLKQTNDNIILTEDLYSLILEIESWL